MDYYICQHFRKIMRFSATVKLQLIVFLWGFTGVIGKLINLNAVPLVWGRILIAELFIFIYICFYTKESLLISKKLILQLLGTGTIIGIHWVLFYGAIKISNISIATATLSTGTLFAAFLEPIIFRRKLKITEILLSIIIIICIGLIFKTEVKYWKGIIMGITCAFLSALFSVINGYMSNKGASSVITFYELLGGFVILNFFMFFEKNWMAIANIERIDILWILVLGSLLTSFPMIATMNLMKYITPFTVMLSVNMEPIYSILIAFIIWKDTEAMSFVFYISTTVMIIAICINGYLKTKNKKLSI